MPARTEDETAFYVKAIEDRKKELKDSTWWEGVKTELTRTTRGVDEIRCLALGSVTDFVNPRFQLAFLLLIAELLKTKKITAWDPIFNAADKLVLEYYKISIVESDPTSGSSLLWYIPHGPISVVKDLPEKIDENIYIGNDLNMFDLEGKSARVQEALRQYRRRAIITSIEPPKNSRWYLAFTSTAIHKHNSKCP